jgi:hypothetical protein
MPWSWCQRLSVYPHQAESAARVTCYQLGRTIRRSRQLCRSDVRKSVFVPSVSTQTARAHSSSGSPRLRSKLSVVASAAFVRSLQSGGAHRPRPKLIAHGEWPLWGMHPYVMKFRFWPVWRQIRRQEHHPPTRVRIAPLRLVRAFPSKRSKAGSE